MRIHTEHLDILNQIIINIVQKKRSNIGKITAPIIRFREFLVENKIFTNEEVDAMQATVDKKIEDAIEYAKAQPQPVVADLEADVYAE